MSRRAVMDEALVVREYFNPNKFDVIFKRQTSMDNYVFRAGIPLGPLYAVCKSEAWLTLPHGYYITHAKNGADFFDLTVNYGNSRGVGEKHPSLPIVDTRWQKK